MGDDGRWDETNVETNANELDEGVGRTTLLAFGHEKTVGCPAFPRRIPATRAFPRLSIDDTPLPPPFPRTIASFFPPPRARSRAREP